MLSSCVSNTQSLPNSHKVSFINEGDIYDTQYINEGDVVQKPQSPFKDSTNEFEYEFIGWFNGDVEWDFSEKIYSEIELTAIYSEKTRYYTIRFVDCDNTLIKEEELEYNEKVIVPDSPFKDSDNMYTYEFLGWENEDKELLESIPNVTKDATYKAKYDETPITNNLETFDSINVIETNKQLQGKYTYYSNSGSLFPISIINKKLEFTATTTNTYGVLSVDLGKVVAGNTYTIDFYLKMLDQNEEYITDGFAYAFGTDKGVTTGSVRVNGILQIYKLFNKTGKISLSFEAFKDAEHFYLLLRSQKKYPNSKLVIDNLKISEHIKGVSQYLYGMGEPLNFSNVNDFDEKKTLELVSMLNAKSYRMWFGTDVFDGWVWNKPLEEFVIKDSVKLKYSEILKDLENARIKEVTAMGHYLPVTASTTSNGNNNLVPHIGTSDYQVFLDKVYSLWFSLAQTFPQVTVWEICNETNNTHYLKYADYMYMSYSDMAIINTDMLYYAYQGVKKANPNATVITAGFAPVTSYYNENTNVENQNITKLDNGINSIEVLLKYIYQNITSNKFPYHNNSKYVNGYDNNPDNYFDGIAWHPYDLGKVGYANTNDPSIDSFNVDLWVEANNRCYQVMKDYSDGNKEVWFTEFGLTTKSENLVYSLTSSGSPYEYYIYFDGGKVYFKDGSNITYKQIPAGYYYINYKDYETYSKNQSNFIKEYFKAMRSSSMNYVHACHFFRMFSSSVDYSWNGLTVLYYGVFTEAQDYLNRGYYPTKKAYTIQEIYGGKGDLMKYSTYSSVHIGDINVTNNAIEDFNNGYVTGLAGNTVKYKGNFYAYSSNNNGNYTLENGVLTMTSTSDSYLAFKLNGFKKNTSYTISFTIPNCETNTAFIIYSSNVCEGVWDSASRLPLLGGTNTAVLLSKLDKNENVYSYTFTPNEDYDSLYFTFRNNGSISFDKISVTIN